MVDLSDFIDPEDDEIEDGGETQDLAALKDSLQALADAIASTNLAVIQVVQGENQGATARVQASIGALKRFHEAFEVLKAGPQDEGDKADEDEES
jgi:hypothetical protein